MTKTLYRFNRFMFRLISTDTLVSRAVWQALSSLVVLVVIVLLARALDFMGWFS